MYAVYIDDRLAGTGETFEDAKEVAETLMKTFKIDKEHVVIKKE